jgi:hypothetical protein
MIIMINEIRRLKDAVGIAFADFVLAAPADKPSRRLELRRLAAELEAAERRLAVLERD